MHRQIRYAHGVSGIVRFGGRYPRIEEEALAHLRSQFGDAEVTELDNEIGLGDRVEIVEGAFAGLEAVVTQAMSSQMRVMVLMDFLGRQVEAVVERANVLVQVRQSTAA